MPTHWEDCVFAGVLWDSIVTFNITWKRSSFHSNEISKNKTETRFLIYNESRTIKPNGMLNLWAMFSPPSAQPSLQGGELQLVAASRPNAINLTSLLCAPVIASAYTSKGIFLKIIFAGLLVYTGVHGPGWALRCLPTAAWCKKGDPRFLQTSKMGIREERLCCASTTAKGQVPRRMTLI